MLYDSPFVPRPLELPRDNGYAVETCIKYTPELDIETLSPRQGDLFNIFVPHIYISWEADAIEKRKIFGTSLYSPKSDIAAIIFHTGILFVQASLKTIPHRRFSTVHNVYEVMHMMESEYTEHAVVSDHPTDLQIQGVVVSIYIDKSPESFLSSTHNKFTSHSLQEPAEYSLRVTDYTIITVYDDLPTIVPVEEYERTRTIVPEFKDTFTGEVGICFNPGIFMQLMSRYNIMNGMFNVHRLLFDVNHDRYEICWRGGTQFAIVKFIEQISVDVVRTRNVSSDVSIFEDVDLSEIGVGKNVISIREKKFRPVSSLLIIRKTE